MIDSWLLAPAHRVSRDKASISSEARKDRDGRSERERWRSGLNEGVMVEVNIEKKPSKFVGSFFLCGYDVWLGREQATSWWLVDDGKLHRHNIDTPLLPILNLDDVTVVLPRERK